MGIYFSKIRSLLEVKRKVDGQEQDLDEENEDQEDTEETNEPQEQNEEETTDEEDEHQADNSASDYSMDVEDDDEENTENQETSTENDADTEDTNQEDNTDDGYSMDVDDEDSDSTDTDDTAEDGQGDDDGYSMDTSDSEDDTSDSDTDSTGDGEDELKSLENDIFKDITPEQMNIKILELKKQYLEVYSTVTDVLTRTNKIQKTSQNIKVLEFIINKLMELKDLIQFYLSNTFDTKTYMENMVNYQQYLVTLNTINRLLKEINVKKGK